MNHSIESILEGFRKDIKYHVSQVKFYPEGSKEWNFHLGWVDALTTYRYKLEAVIRTR